MSGRSEQTRRAPRSLSTPALVTERTSEQAPLFSYQPIRLDYGWLRVSLTGSGAPMQGKATLWWFIPL